MKFCPKCGSFCSEDFSKKQAVCSRCGHILNLEAPKEFVNQKEIDEKIFVIDKNTKDLIGLPRVNRICPKCGHKEAYVSMVASRSEDDFETERYRCVSCGHSWRDESV